MVESSRLAVFLNGPIGTGKTSLGAALAERLDGRFIDSDDLLDPDKPWFAQVKRSSERLLGECLIALRERRLIFVAKPLRRRDWTYFRCKLARNGISSVCLTLSATYESIVDPRRGRVFDDGELRRIKEMIDQGYASRPFSDLVIATDEGDFPSTLARIVVALGPLRGK
jgi:hypothetical protein